MINLRILAANLLSEENNFLCQDMVVSDCSYFTPEKQESKQFSKEAENCVLS